MHGRVATTAAIVALGLCAALSTAPASASVSGQPTQPEPARAAQAAPIPFSRPALHPPALLVAPPRDLDPRTSAARRPQGGAPTATTASPRPRRGVIYLTFDDGPRPDATPAILAILQEHGAHATFFVMGSRAQRHRALLAAIRAGGHAVGNHTWSHPELTSVGTTRIRQEIASTAAVIGPTKCFRAPYGSTSPRVERAIRAARMHHYLWDVDTSDWMRPSARTITATVLRHAHDGAIVLMHDGGGDRSRTVAAVRRIVPALIDAGYELRALPRC